MKKDTEKMKWRTRYKTSAEILAVVGNPRNFGKTKTVAAWVEHFWQAAAERMAYAAQLNTGWRS